MLNPVKKILVPQLTAIVTEFQTIWKNSSLYIFVLGIFGSASPFFYFMVPADMEGAFGYTYMASLLWALTVPIMAISYGLLIHTLSLKTPPSFRPPFKILSYTILSVGVFYLIFLFLPVRKNSPVLLHLSGIALASIVLVIMMFKLNRIAVKLDDKLALVTRRLFEFIITEVLQKKYVSQDKRKEYVQDTDKLIKDVSDIVK